jgi:hypothetical protein
VKNQSQGIFNEIPKWLLLGLIVLAAHGLCLAATYYLDDYYFVVDGSGYGAARWTIHFLEWKILDGGENPTYDTGINALIPGLIFALNYHLFGPSPVASTF